MPNLKIVFSSSRSILDFCPRSAQQPFLFQKVPRREGDCNSAKQSHYKPEPNTSLEYFVENQKLDDRIVIEVYTVGDVTESTNAEVLNRREREVEHSGRISDRIEE